MNPKVFLDTFIVLGCIVALMFVAVGIYLAFTPSIRNSDEEAANG